jgi:hypothetical protein
LVEQQELAALSPEALQQELSFLALAQEASIKEAEARTMVRRRIIEKCVGWPRVVHETPFNPFFQLLAHLHRSRWWRRGSLGSAGDKATGDHGSCKSEEGVFHSLVFVAFLFACLSRHRSGASTCARLTTILVIAMGQIDSLKVPSQD